MVGKERGIDRLSRGLGRVVFGDARGLERWTRVVALLLVVLVPVIVVWPWWTDLSTYGFHDWDVMTSHRYLAVKSLREFGELPEWNPYACGGFPAWGYVEGGTNIVSPWLPFYLLLDIRVALRVEVLGMAMLSSIGTWLVAGRFVKSSAARLLVVALFAVNGRFGLQAAAGHGWHLAYAFLPWGLYFFDRLVAPPTRAGAFFGLGAVFALLVYSGGIYPLPHTVLALGLYASCLAIADRSLRPVWLLAASGLFGLVLALPKLLPLLATFHRAPRVIESTEQLGVGAFFTLLVSRDQAFYSRPAEVSPYGWHEWGMYISALGVVALVLGVLFAKGARESALKIVGVTFGVLGFGAFAPFAPWTLLHAHVPVFHSQHVPSRFLYPATLFLGIVAASFFDAALPRLRSRYGRTVDVAFIGIASFIAIDVAQVAQKPMADAMWMVAPEGIPRDAPFSFVTEPPYHYVRRDWAGPMYLAMLGNTGVMNCYGTPPFEEKGALSRNHRRFRGQVESGVGTAKLELWSPNTAVVALSSVSESSRVIYNMNFDEGWQAMVTNADGSVVTERVFDHGHRVAVEVPSGATAVRFVYRAPGLRLGAFAAGLGLLGFVGWARLRRRERGLT